MALLFVSICFSLILISFIWLAKTREANVLQAINTRHDDLRLALKGTGEAIWTWRLDTQELTQVGFEPLIDGHFPDIINAIEFIQIYIHPEDAPDFHKAINNHLQGQNTDFEVSYRLRHYSQGWIWITSRGRVVEYDANNNPLRIAAASKNTSAKRDFENDSRIALAVVKSMNEAVGVVDLDFHFISINPAFSRITGYI